MSRRRSRPDEKGRALLILAISCVLSAVPAFAGSKAGMRALRHGDWERAVAQLRLTLQADPTDVDTATSLGQALSHLGQRDEAEAAYRHAIELAPDHFRAYAGLADLLSTDQRRWELRDEVSALLKSGLEKVAKSGGNPGGKINLILAMANFERSIGRPQAAKERLSALDQTTLAKEQRQRINALKDGIQQEERARALSDWPEPQVPAAASRELDLLEEALVRGEAAVVEEGAERLAGKYPGWRAPHWLRARASEALGRPDDATRELTILTHLYPSSAEGWRHLGRILALHGGLLDADKADEALLHALALDPGYFDLWLLRAQVLLRKNQPDAAQRALQHYVFMAPDRAEDPEVRRLFHEAAALIDRQVRPPSARHAAPPSEHARQLLAEAEDWLQVNDPAGLAPGLVAAALEDSPGFVEAAATAFALTAAVPERTVRALWEDGDALLLLSRKVRGQSGSAETRLQVQKWLDRAVELGVAAARFDRAEVRLLGNDRAGCLDDLMRYVGSDPDPAELDQARVLLFSVSVGQRDQTATAAQLKLLSDRPQEAAEALGGRCDEKTPKERLLLLGTVQEWRDDLPQAIACYRQALHRGPDEKVPLQRLASVGARAPLSLSAGLLPELLRAAARHLVAADLALARLDDMRGDREGALLRLDRFLRDDPQEDPNREAARALRDRILLDRARSQRQVLLRRLWPGVAIGMPLLLAMLFLLWWRLHGTRLSRALSRSPNLFPEVARIIGELRHDVLKHRTSVLSLVAQGQTPPEVRVQVARVLWEPERASDLIVAAYARLCQVALTQKVTLHPLRFEPAFGPLYRDLRRAEALVRDGREKERDAEALRRIDKSLREVYFERLGALLRLSPRVRVDATVVSDWIGEVEAEVRAHGGPWTPPMLLLQELHLDFPLERSAMGKLFANLLRNAQEAVSEAGGGCVMVRVGEEREATGRRLLMLLVADSAPGELTIEGIEARESGRGLAIVRDLVHEWRGHLVIRPEDAPYRKGVGACFPA